MDDWIPRFVRRFDLPEAAREALEAHLGVRPTVSDTLWTEDADETDEIELVPSDRVEGRYVDLGQIGVGGTGVVRRVRDRRLDRIVAMKVLHPHLMGRQSVLARFLGEAGTTARLQHPGIVPVHSVGQLADGRPYFTMKEVAGRTLTAVLREAHDLGDEVRLRRLVDALRVVCEAVAYAHARGVLHRDLKPENVMLGSWGEVLVMDWGLAKGGGDHDDGDGPAHRTRVGAIAGTPAYMSPEQARGELAEVTAATDVYSLGAILFEVLWGRPPYPGSDGTAVIARVVAGAPDLPPGRPWSEELWRICQQAMARDAADRPSAQALAEAVADWLDGAQRRARALAIVAEAEALVPRIEALKQDPQTEREATLLSVDRFQLLRAALTHEPELAEAHAALASHYRERLVSAEARRDAEGAAASEVLLRAHDRRGEHAAWLKGDGAVTLATDPPRAEVRLYRYVERGRRLVEEPAGVIGATPLQAHPLPMGSWLLELRAPGRAVVRYPVHVERQGHWDAGTVVALPAADALGPDDVYVPAGPFRCGGDEQALNPLPGRRVWVDAFVMRRFPVTNTEYIAFLDDLVAKGREEEALRHVPRERAGTEGELGAMVYGRDERGRFHLRPDADGDVWLPEYPVVLIPWVSAVAYAAWLAEATGLPWRLPTEVEWEKAARGVDGRAFPWGDHCEPEWCCIGDSHEARPLPDVVDSYPVDVSVYGVRGMAGNVRDWCEDVAGGPRGRGGARVVRGGMWIGPETFARCATRMWSLPSFPIGLLGFRLAR